MPDILAPASGRHVACIDVGTNSIKILVADLSEGRAVPVFELSATTRLGEGMTADDRRLREDPMRRSLAGLAQLMHASEEYRLHVNEIVCVGTAALRDAENAQEFIRSVQEELGLRIEVISGEEEARLSFLAVRRDPFWRSEPHLYVIDVGGGSTEVIEGAPNSDQIVSRHSVNLGAVKVTERFLKSDPPTPEQIELANSAARAEFARVTVAGVDAAGTRPCVVGVGGTLTTLAAICIGGVKETLKIHGYRLQLRDLQLQIASMGQLTIAQKREVPGLDPRRADIILGGAIVLSHAMSAIGSTYMDVSTRGLRWGVLYDRFPN